MEFLAKQATLPTPCDVITGVGVQIKTWEKKIQWLFIVISCHIYIYKKKTFSNASWQIITVSLHSHNLHVRCKQKQLGFLQLSYDAS